MSELKKIPARSEVPVEDTWAIEDMYTDKNAWEADVEKVKTMADELTRYAGKLGDSAESLFGFCQLSEELGNIIDDVYGYACRIKDVDTTDPEGQRMSSVAMTMAVECESKLSFSVPEILAIPDEKLDGFYKEKPELQVYRRYLTDVRRCREHILSPEMEKLLADTGEMAQTPGQVYSMLNNADLTFPSAQDSDGKEYEVTHGSFIPLMESPDRQLRKSAFQSVYKAYAGISNTAAGLLSGQVSQLRFYAKARKYDSTLEAALDDTNVPVSVYKNLLKTVHEDISYLHRYMRLRKKLLGVD